MSSKHVVPVSDEQSLVVPKSKNITPLVWFSVLLILAYFPVLKGLVGDWIENEDMGHGFFVPILAGYIAWTKFPDMKPLHRNWVGLSIVLYSAAQLYIATLGVELFLARTAFILAVAGCVLFICGLENLRILAFPLLLLPFMIPLPAIIYNQLTFPLQLLASRVAEVTLSLLGIPVLREGNVLELASQRLSVVEACSGIRSLLSLSFLALIYSHFFDRRGWMKIVLLTVTIPVAVIANAARVCMTGILSEWNPELARGFFHLVEGWIVFAVAMFTLVVLHQMISRIHNRMTQTGPARRSA